MLVLLMEDVSSLNKLYTQMLERLGHKVLSEPNGNKAVGILKSNPVDLVLTDMMMEGKEGFETIHEIRENGFELPIIAMSAVGTYAEHATDLGADGNLTKPFFFEDLESAISKVVK